MRHHVRSLPPVPSRIWLALAILTVSIIASWLTAEAGESLPSATPDFPSLMRPQADQLAKLESNKSAINLFVSAIGPSLQLGDVARTLGTTALPPKLTKELLVPDLTGAVQRLMGSLAAWHLASTVRQAIRERQFATVTERLSGTTASRAWLDQQDNVSWHDQLKQLGEAIASPEWAQGQQGEPASALAMTLLERATSLEVEALQASYKEWDRIRNWKDRVRGLRGQTRLCGTWQWIIHNHQQHHQEQKLSLLFPPVGAAQPTPGLVETIVLGDNVYLRWEIDGQAQEDSLQFSKEGQRLEGTFVNSQGGWGSISGKRSAGCTP